MDCCSLLLKIISAVMLPSVRWRTPVRDELVDFEIWRVSTLLRSAWSVCSSRLPACGGEQIERIELPTVGNACVDASSPTARNALAHLAGNHVMLCCTDPNPHTNTIADTLLGHLRPASVQVRPEDIESP